jgi:hypothetical protein
LDRKGIRTADPVVYRILSNSALEMVQRFALPDDSKAR